MIRVQWVSNDKDSFKRAVIASLCVLEGDIDALPNEIVNNPMFGDITTQELRSELGQLVGKVNSNLSKNNPSTWQKLKTYASNLLS